MLACGQFHMMAILEDGSLYSWGKNEYHQLGKDYTEDVEGSPQKVRLPERASYVAVGAYHSIVIGESGKLWAWGQNTSGELGYGMLSLSPSPAPLLSLPVARFTI
jgi:hypothetical protein